MPTKFSQFTERVDVEPTDEVVGLRGDDNSRWPLSTIISDVASDVADLILPITNDEMEDMAEATIKGRSAGSGTGDPEDLTAAQAAAIVETELFPVENSDLADMAQGTIKGRALAAGTGDPQDLTDEQAADIIWDEFSTSATRRQDEDIGFNTVPPIVTTSASIQLDADHCGTGIVRNSSGVTDIVVPLDATDDLVDGFIVTLTSGHADADITISPESGVTVLSLNDGTTGDFIIEGIGIGTLWKISADLWYIHGSNVVNVP